MQSIAFLQNLSSWEIILIFIVVLLFFGAKRLPELFRSFGKSLKEFKKATSEIEEDFKTAMEEEEHENRNKQAKTASSPATTDPKEVEVEVEDNELAQHSEDKKAENGVTDEKETTKS